MYNMKFEAELLAVEDCKWLTNPMGQSGFGTMKPPPRPAGNGFSWDSFMASAAVVVGVGAPLVSTNQSSFRRASSPAGASDLFIAAAYGAGTFVAVGFSTNIITSRDGFVWNAGPSLGPLTGLTYANGRFVAVGTNVFTSVDGATWEMGHLDSGMNLEDVVYGAGTFVSVGNGGTIAVSPYGLSWIRVNSGVKTDLLGVAYAAGNFVAVGDAGVILTSTDGRTWQRRPSPVASFLWSVAYGNGTFVAVGNGGVSLQSGVLVANPTPFQLGEGQIFSNGHFGLTVFGQVGQSYSIEASSNLIDWMPLGSVIATNSAMQFLDHTAPPPSWRFYRGVSGVAAQ